MQRQVLYAFLLDPEHLRTLQGLSSLIPDDVEIKNVNEQHFLIISEPTQEQVLSTQYYRINWRKWISTTEYIKKITSTEITSPPSYIFSQWGFHHLPEVKPEFDTDLDKCLSEFVMTDKQRENLHKILDSDLSKFIIDHGWCDVQWQHEISVNETVRSLEFLIELDVKIEGEYAKKLQSIGSYPCNYYFGSGKTLVKFVELCDNTPDDDIYARFTMSKYYRNNRIGWEYLDPHRIAQTIGNKKYEYGRLLINIEDACDLTPGELKKLELIKEAFGDHFIGASWYDNRYEVQRDEYHRY